MKILYVTTIAATMWFFPEHIKLLQQQGHTVELACNMQCDLPERVQALNCVSHPLPFSRSPLSSDNLKAYRALKRLLQEGQYDVVHTHTPNASVCVRLAARKLRKSGLKVMYTAHGFHFYKGAPLKNWLLYYPVEWICAHWTDVLITINQEDYALAMRKLCAKKVVYVPGVGLNFAHIVDAKLNDAQLREELNIPEGAILLLSVGELNANKNHGIVIEVLKELSNANLHYCVAGSGDQMESLAIMAKTLGIEDRVHLLGYRKDIAALYHAADCYVHPSYREGLPVALMEAMAAGLPCIASQIRGNTDLIVDGKGGYLVPPKDVNGFAHAIMTLANDKSLRQQMGAYNTKAVEQFDISHVKEEMRKIYQEVLDR